MYIYIYIDIYRYRCTSHIIYTHTHTYMHASPYILYIYIYCINIYRPQSSNHSNPSSLPGSTSRSLLTHLSGRMCSLSRMCSNLALSLDPLLRFVRV
jgi:hypothetical protein